ncbi:hypothetical protein EON64_13460, partial [archaeon]
MKLDLSLIIFGLGVVEVARAFSLNHERASFARSLTKTSLKLTEPRLFSKFAADHGEYIKTNRLNSVSVGASSSKTVQGSKKGLGNSLKIGAIFGLWYVLNIGYNIYNKKVLNMMPKLTYTVAWLQLVIGLLYLLPVWLLGIRKTPQLTMKEVQKLVPIAILHSLTHLGAVVSLGAGAVSFTHIVKAAEPAVSAALSAVLTQSYLPLPVYLSLIPVMGGVAMASATELSFSWLSSVAEAMATPPMT